MHHNIKKGFKSQLPKWLLPLSAFCLTPLSQAADLITSIDFNNGEIRDHISNKTQYDTGLEQDGLLTFSSTSKSGLALDVDNLRYLRLPLADIAASNGQFTVKFDYYHISSKDDGSTAWNSHSFAIRDLANQYVWSHGFRNPGNDFWSSSISGLQINSDKVKGDANAIPDFNTHTWHEYVLVFANNRLTWYVDGVFAYYQEFDTDFSDWQWLESDIILGARYQNGSVTELDGYDYYQGLTGTNTHPGSVKAIFDNVRIWNDALDAQTIASGVESLVPEAPYLTITTAQTKLNSTEQSLNLTIDTNQNWEITDLPAWIHASQLSGNSTANVTLNIEANPLNSARSGQISISDKTINIQQSAAHKNDIADAIIFPDSTNQKVEYMFYDIKSHWGAQFSENLADGLFLVDGFNGIRTSIYGTLDKPDTANGKPAHPEAGVVLAEYYQPEVTKIKQALERNPDLIIFASKKLNGGYSFPAWVEQANGIIPQQYAILLADYIEYMASEGIPTHILGIDNEYVFNEGQIWPDRHQKIVAELQKLADERGFEMPKIIGYEDYAPGLRDWVKNLNQNGWLDSMDIYGTHYYPHDRTQTDIAKLRTDIQYSGFKDRWHSELHWDTKSNIPDILEIEDGMASLFDMTDHGFNGLMWWDYRRYGLRGNLLTKLMGNMLGYSPIMTIDHDGVDILEDGKLHSRVFRKDNHLQGWLLNLNPENSFDNYTLTLNNKTLGDTIEYIQYNETTPWGEKLQANRVSDSSFELNIDPMSVITFSTHLKTDKDTLIFSESWQAANLGLIEDQNQFQADNQWHVNSTHASFANIKDINGPLTHQALQLNGNTENRVAWLAHTLNPTLAESYYDSLSLSFTVFVEQFNNAGKAASVELVSDQDEAVYQINLNTSNNNSSIAELLVNGQQSTQSISLGKLAELEAGVPYRFHITLQKTATNQTNLSYVIYRNKINWQQGETFVDTAIKSGTEISKFRINAAKQNSLALDDIQLTADGLVVPDVEGDLNGDRTIDNKDFVLFRSQLGKQQDDEGFNAKADLDSDGIISRRDYSLFYSLYRQQ